jgi:hypothetical protein
MEQLNFLADCARSQHHPTISDEFNSALWTARSPKKILEAIGTTGRIKDIIQAECNA